MKVSAESKNNHTVVTVKGTLSIENISPFETLLKKYVDSDSHILINLSDLTFIDSSSLGIIVVYYTKSEKNSKHFALVNVNQDIMQMFRITGLDKRIRIFKTMDEAVQELNLN